MWPIDEEKKPKLIREITDAFVSEGIPAEAVNVVIHETPKVNWGTAGVQHSVTHGR